MKKKHIIFILKWILKAVTLMRVRDKELEEEVETFLRDLDEKA